MRRKVLFARVLLVIYLCEMFLSNPLMALGGGPSQPEMEGFKSIDASNLVDPFTGNFSYNIPLFEIGGYPINLVYDGPSGVEQEASWVGMGWTLNPGAINHDVRGIPDDFHKEEVKREVNIRKNWTLGLSANKKGEIFGFKKNNAVSDATTTTTPVSQTQAPNPIGGKSGTITLMFNNYNGFGIELGINLSKGLQKSSTNGNSYTANLGLSSGPNGASASGGLSYNIEKKKSEGAFGIEGGFNSRDGLKDLKITRAITVKTNSIIPKSTRAAINSKLNKLSEKLNDLNESGSNARAAMVANAISRNQSYLSSSHTTTSSSSISFNYSPSIPLSDYPLNAKSLTGNLSFGKEYKGKFSNTAFGIFYNSQELASHEIVDTVMGVLYLEDARNSMSLDYTKEKNIPFNRYTSTLPLPYLTPDLYAVMAQGVSGQFKIRRSDNGVLSIKRSATTSNGKSIGVEVGPGSYFRGGIDVNVANTRSTNKKWDDDNNISYHNSFKGNNNTRYSPAYFQNTQELSCQSVDETYSELNQISSFRPHYQKEGMRMIIENQYINENSAQQLTNLNNFATNPSDFIQDERNSSQSVMSYLTGYEANKIPTIRDILSFPMNEIVLDNTSSIIEHISRTYRNPKDVSKHISAITITKPGGIRYTFGIPVYNNKKEEVTFNVTENNDLNSSTIRLFEQVPTVENNVGKDWFYEKTSTPGYAHSYLLTEIASSDYIDLQNDGLSDDDLGSLVKFNYTRLYSDYKWRTPYNPALANYSPGFHAVNNDDKASYIYGEKEIWFTHSIESKDQIAIFHVEVDRHDGIEAYGEYNTSINDVNAVSLRGDKKLMRLVDIKIYSKAEYKLHTQSNSTTPPVPIKTVHFEYEEPVNSLFPNIENSDVAHGGKLTLKKVYFTYGTSSKASMNAYEFEYFKTNAVEYHPYHYNNNDRWGNYKDEYNASSNLPNNLFPFVEQDQNLQNNNCKAGHIKAIHLPSGGKIEIDLESDDYAYVQDKKVGNMFRILGFGPEANSIPDFRLHGGGGILHPQAFNYMFLDLPIAVQSNQDLYEKYLKGLNDYLYFDCAVRLDREYSTHSDKFDRIKGYAKIASYGLIEGSNTRAYIHLENVFQNANSSINPIAFAALQTLKLHLPSVAYPESYVEYQDTNLEDLVLQLFGQLTSIKELFQNFNNKALRQQKCTIVNTNESWVRLVDPDQKKLGGGSRVKSVRVYDNWEEMSGISGVEASYGQDYSYTTTNPSTGLEMSSGVASYEPMIGIEDYLGRSPIAYEERVRLAPNRFYYAEEPIGEQLFPSPEVGYSKVTITPIGSDNNGSIGHEVNEFYTSKDYPVFVGRTDFEILLKANPISKLFNINAHQFCSADQGFVVVVNDMHGKPKGNRVYNGRGELIQSIENIYQEMENAPCKMVSNMVKCVNENGQIGNSVLGMDTEIFQEMNENEVFASTPGVMLNLDVINMEPMPAPIPIPIPLGLFSKSRSYTRTSAVTKFVKKSGILSKVQVFENGSTSTVENILYDQKTSQLVLSSVTNSFGDKHYNISIPAYWGYKGMGPSYQNLGLNFKSITIGNDAKLNSNNIEQYFQEGDELLITDVNNPDNTIEKYYAVYEGNSLIAINKSAQKISEGSYDIKIIRSGFKNKADQPLQTIQTYTNPIVSNGTAQVLDLTNLNRVIQASAIEYTDYSIAECKKEKAPDCSVSQTKKDAYVYILKMAFYYMQHFDLPSNTPLTSVQSLYNWYINQGQTPFTQDTQFLFDFGSINIPIPHVITNNYEISIGGCPVNIQFNVLGNTEVINTQPIGEWEIIVFPNSPSQIPANNSGYFALHFDLNYKNCIDCATLRAGDVTLECPCPLVCKIADLDKLVNPYALGLKGNWNPIKSHTFMEGRNTELSNGIRLRYDGVLSNWEPFWKFNGSTLTNAPISSKWKWDAQVTLYDNKGNALEDQDPLFRYSSALFGYNGLYNTAVASNARYQQIANDNFEDYDFTIDASDCFQDHWNFKELSTNTDIFYRSPEFAHTGLYSMAVKPSKNISVSREIDNTPYLNEVQKNQIGQYILKEGNCLKKFSPLEGDYIVTGWVKVGDLCNPNLSINSFITVKVGSNQVVQFSPSGQVVEGWQKIEGKFSVGSNDSEIIVGLNNNESIVAYFDDIRIHPYHSNMKTFVYNPYSMKLMSSLDENNYATFFEYDLDGKLIRVKKETEKGIVTLKEGRQEMRVN